MAASAVFEWKSNSKLLHKIMNANNKDKWTSETFIVANTSFHVAVYPNKTNQDLPGYFGFYLNTDSLSSWINALTLRQTVYCRQTMTKSTYINTYDTNYSSFGTSRRLILAVRITINAT